MEIIFNPGSGFQQNGEFPFRGRGGSGDKFKGFLFTETLNF